MANGSQLDGSSSLTRPSMGRRLMVLFLFALFASGVIGGTYAMYRHDRSPTLRVTLTLVAPTLADNTPVYVTGGLSQLGDWNPGKERMTSQGNHRWSKSITAPGAASFEYKYTLGSWDREAADSTGAPLHNLVAKGNRTATFVTTVRAWTNGAKARVLNGQVTGTVRYHRAIKGAGIAERDVAVWLPPGYDASKRSRYPVLYMLDGQNVFDPATSSFGTDWAADEAADSLIRAKVIEPVIIVAAYNTKNRNEEYLPGGKSGAYLDFMVHALKPFIDSAYRTRPEAAHTMIGGSSAGGVSAFMLVWEHPSVFSRALCFSPAFTAPAKSDMKFDYVANVQRTAKPPKGVFFYIDVGGVALETQLRPGVDAMLAALKAKGYREGRDFAFVSDAAAEHNEAAWRARLPHALTLVLGQTKQR